jgi:hypothetical protein
MARPCFAGYRSIAQAETTGDMAEAQRIRDAGLQPPGYTNSVTGTIGGPILRNKLFFFFSLWKMADRKNTPPGSEFSSTRCRQWRIAKAISRSCSR